MSTPLVSVQWLATHIDDPTVVVLDTSMNKVLGMTAIDYPHPTFIPNSYRCDLENVLVDISSPLPNTFPTADCFTRFVQALGINANTHVVLYDNQGMYSSPRAWWIFTVMGHQKVSVLDGGLPQWIKDNHPTTDELSLPPVNTGNAKAEPDWQKLISAQQLLNSLSDTQVILDSRSPSRFRGDKPEPRQGMRSGHIPGAVNLPFHKVMKGLVFKSPQTLHQVFEDLLGFNPTSSQPIVFSCGSGITACIILLASRVAGYTNTQLYDGSWSEWGGSETLPVESNAYHND